MPTRVLVVDDSAVVRKLLSHMLSGDPELEVVGTASDPFIARDKVKQLHPDVLTLDVEMPRMDGITFLRNLMRLHPLPVVMVSSLTERGAEVTLEALEVGAVDFVTKPRVDVARTLEELADELRGKVKAAARARVRAWVPPDRKHDPSDAATRAAGVRHLGTTDRVIVLGSSTGGTVALQTLLADFPADAPGTLVTQHFPDGYSGPFARRLDSTLRLRAVEAEDGAPVLAGHVYVAPGGRHLRLDRSGARYLCRVVDAPPVNRHRPSVDVLFTSAAEVAGANALGAILTGMGDDGARGLKAMRDAGAATVAQDEATSVVWGMPGSAVRLGAAAEVLPLPAIAQRLLELARAR